VRRPSGMMLGGAGFLALLLGGALWTGMLGHHTTTAELDALFRERIPVGSSSRRVESFLDSVHVYHTAYLPQEREIYASWDRTWIGLVGEGWIEARFFFDEQRRMTRYELHEGTTYL